MSESWLRLVSPVCPSVRNWCHTGTLGIMLGVLVFAVSPARAQAPDTAPAEEAADEAASVESLFANYLHFALIGRFQLADQRYGQPLVSRPEFNPLTDESATKLVELSEKHQNSIATLQQIIASTDIRENAKKLLDLIREAHLRKRMDPARIKANIQLLRGMPMQRAVGLERLKDSGEYAVPWMLGVLTDPNQEALVPFVLNALPQLGRGAVNPLLAALDLQHEPTLHNVIEMLGKLGYPQALPYLKALAGDEQVGPSVRESAAKTIARIIADDPSAKQESAVALFHQLARQYYDDADSLRADPREDRANVWYLRQDARPGEDVVTPIAVPREIYNLVMCMRCSERSLRLAPDQPQAVALWLAANFRREARLGLDVQSDETIDAKAIDPTRPENFPRGIYFARSAGPTCCQIALARAIEGHDPDVALGTIAALNATAGAETLVNPADPNGSSLAAALFFPDLLVRFQAALALGRAMPSQSFPKADEVVPVLASVLSPGNQRFYLLVDPSEPTRREIEHGLQAAGGVVVAADRLNDALTRAREQVTHLDGVFLASDIERPTAVEAIRQLATDDRFALAPVVILVKEGDTLILDRIAQVDDRVGKVFIVAGENSAVDPKLIGQMIEHRDRVAKRFGHRDLSPEAQLGMAMASAQTLYGLAATRSPVFDLTAADKPLIDTLTTHESPELRVAAAQVLSWRNTEPAQRAIADVALGSDQTEPLRMAAFAALADSARRFGSHLDAPVTDRLIDQTFHEPNLVLRTAASQALGALNPPASRGAEIILGQTKG